jgi:hypothetical protein
MLNKLIGCRTYIIAVVVGVVAALQYAGVIVPEYVYTILGAFGLGFLRKKKKEKK